MFKKILIANRGEIALRIIRAARELGIPVVSVYSTADDFSLHKKFANEAICIGPPDSRDSYLNIPAIIAAAELTNSDAIHPGYGFLSENSDFSNICNDNKIIFIGPDADIIKAMGHKSTAKQTMVSVGVPVIPGSEGVVSSVSEGLEIADKIGYPVIVKAASGGGGKGMRIIFNLNELEKSINASKLEAKKSFDDDSVYIEKFLTNPKHIEIQILADSYGNVISLGERDCSIQYKHQKLLEECPSTILNEKQRNQISSLCVKAIKSIGYEGVGTLEEVRDRVYTQLD